MMNIRDEEYMKKNENNNLEITIFFMTDVNDSNQGRTSI